MKQLSILILFCLICGLLVACESTAEARNTEKINVNATVIEETDVYNSMALASTSTSLEVGDKVVVKEKSRCSMQVCLVENEEISGWVRCAYLDMEA